MERYMSRLSRIRNTLSKPMSTWLEGEGDKILAWVEVDGEDLGYNSHIWQYPKGECFFGIGSYKDGKETTVALKFDRKVPPSSKGENGTTRQMMPMGKVVVHFCRAIERGSFLEDSSYDSEWKGGVVNISSNKKAVKSSAGSTTMEHECEARGTFRESGEELHTIELQYCTTLGLIKAGVFNQTPTSAAAAGDSSRRPISSRKDHPVDGPRLLAPKDARHKVAADDDDV